jgi:hypothetical protein
MFGRAGVAVSMAVSVAATALAASPWQKFLLSILYQFQAGLWLLTTGVISSTSSGLIMPASDFLGEFEQIVLLALIRLGDGAYGVAAIVSYAPARRAA